MRASRERIEPGVVIPQPGGRARRSVPAPVAPDPGSRPNGMVDTTAPHAHGGNRLMACALPLLNAVREIRAMRTAPDPELLRARLGEAVRRFEQHASAAGIDPRHVIAARYTLCTALDEAIGATSWGGSSGWSRRTLLVAFHDEAYGGDKVYRLVARLAEDPRGNLEVLEVIHAAMALGFLGRLRADPAQADVWRDRLARLIREARGPFERELSPAWAPAPIHRRRLIGDVPLWAALAILAVGLLALHLYLATALNRASDPVYARILSLRIAGREPPRPAVGQLAAPRLAALLEPDIRAGNVTVREDPHESVVTLRGDGLFASGDANAASAYEPLLRRIAEALASVDGDVLVTGHTDDQPMASVRYPSNWHLSRARARSVVFLLVEHGVPARRLSAEGRGDAEPLAPNDSPAGRARNRRVEIVLRPNARSR